MRQPIHVVRFLLLALALVVAGHSTSFADDRGEARTHYQAGVKFYSGGDYRSAIREFSAAQQLAPADLNNYNLALCYDKLGDPEPAIQYYRAYLDKMPNTDKRAEIDASIQRLDAAAKSVASKKADELKKIDDAKRAEDARKAADDARRADDQRRADDARAAAEARKRPPVADPDTGFGGAGPAGGAGAGAVGGGSTGVPSTGVVSTGDAQLDRVQGLDINQIRDQRVGGNGSGIPANDGRGPAVAANGPQGAGAPPIAGAPTNPNGVPMNGGPQDQPKKATPIYKKWWFWAVVAVSAYVVYQIATDNSQPSTTAHLLPEVGAQNAQPGGMTLLHW